MKKIISIILISLLMLSFGICASADNPAASNSRAVIGGDLTPEQITAVYNSFGISRYSVPELTMTNARERAELSGFVDPSLIGSKSISCIYISLPGDGSGMDISTSNITWCTPQMYISALATAGITDAKIIVSAPFEVSGTAALTGVFWAYEDITGQKLDDTAKLVATQELTITGDLAQQLGTMDTTYIIDDLKLMLDETKTMTDDQIRSEIIEIGRQYNVTLNDTQISKLIELCRSLEGLDEDQLAQRVREVQGTLNKVSAAKTKITGFTQGVQKVVTSVSSFFKKIGNIIGYFG